MIKIWKFFSGLFWGGIVGGLIGLLLAPSVGSESRARIKENFYYVKSEVQKAAMERSEALKKELAQLQSKG